MAFSRASGQLAVAMLVLLAAAARASSLQPTLGSSIAHRLRALQLAIVGQRLVVVRWWYCTFCTLGLRPSASAYRPTPDCTRTVISTRTTSSRIRSNMPENSSKASRLYSCLGFFWA